MVPLLYEGRHVEQRVDAVAIDSWFERVLEGLSEKEKADLKRKYAKTARLFHTAQAISMIAFDVSHHFNWNWKGKGFKGQLVAPSKRAAILYKKAFEELGEVTSEVVISAPDDREGEERIDESSSDEVKRFWKTMMDRYGDEATYNKRIIEAFKKREEPDILIVVSKLLTGFDAPRNTVLYLARMLKEHTLLQAIARVNRVAEGKEFGFILDYCSVLGELSEALSNYSALEGFDEANLAGTVNSIAWEIAKLGQRHSSLGTFSAAYPIPATKRPWNAILRMRPGGPRFMTGSMHGRGRWRLPFPVTISRTTPRQPPDQELPERSEALREPETRREDALPGRHRLWPVQEAHRKAVGYVRRGG